MADEFGAARSDRSGFRFDHSWQRDLPDTFVAIAPDSAPAPQIVVLNTELAATLGLNGDVLAGHPAWFAGGELPKGASSIALAYAGHQFGGFSPSLGDGRAHLLGEHLAPDGRRWDIQLKGSGRTPFSRGGDGKAVLGPMLREYVISEAMAALGIPTTRVLAVAKTGETVWRDAGPLPGAVVTRVAASHLRVGTFQYFAARDDREKLMALLDFAIARHDPDLAGLPDRAILFFDRVIGRQAKLIARWMGVGFVHGVMNTDNMALSGETIDYGPCAFIDDYAPGAVFSSIDRQGRYALANQPLILGWNLARLAETLVPLVPGPEEEVVKRLNEKLGQIAERYRVEWLAVMRAKLGLAGEDEADGLLVDDLLRLIAGVDWTGLFVNLGSWASGEKTALRMMFDDFVPIEEWLQRWEARRAPDAAERMSLINPRVIPRNHLVEEALSSAEAGDIAPFENLVAAVQNPYRSPIGQERYTLPAPTGFGRYVTYCGT